MKIKNLDSQDAHFDTVVRWVFDEWSPITPYETLTSTHGELSQRSGAEIVPHALVAETADGNPLGTVSLVECDYAPRNNLSPWLADLYVAPEQRNRGVGSALVKQLELWALHNGIETLYLITRYREDFYRRLGWTLFEQLRYHGVKSALMRRELRDGLLKSK